MEQGRDDTVQSVLRTAQVLEALTAGGASGMRLAELTAATGMNRASVHRLLKSLVATGLVDRDERDALYFPGLKLVSIAAAASDRFGLAQISAEGCRRIAEATGDTVFVQLRQGHETTCVARYEGSFPIRTLTLDIGQRRPLGIGAGGLACLSTLAERAEIAADLAGQYRVFGIDDAEVLAGAEAARAAGFAVDADAVLEGVTGISVPMRGSDGRAFAALTVAAISTRMKGAHRAKVARHLGREARALEQRLAPLLGRLPERKNAHLLGPG